MIMSELNVNPRTIFCHDNIDVLQGINAECIDLIYLDPPFNKKKTFTAPVGSHADGASFRDVFQEEDVKDDWVRDIEGGNSELHGLLAGIRNFSNSYNYCYSVYMAIRLMECHRILKDTGSIWLHCDPTMSHYLKLILDCIFGEKNFRNEIVWCYHAGGASKKYFPRKHDIIFLYGKNSARSVHNILRMPYRDAYAYDENHDDSMGVYHPDGKMLHDWWEISVISSKAKERTGYPTQKPLKLMERIIKASSNTGDLVLDPFCGCATTCIAAELLGRKWIGIDVSIKAYELVKKRLAKEVPPDLFSGEPEFHTTPPKQHPDQPRETRQVYIMENPSIPYKYKIGFAKNPQQRARQIMAQAPEPTKVLFQHETEHYRELERFILNKYKRNKEWVDGNLEDIKNDILQWRP